MAPQRELVLSPDRFLADVEQAVTDRTVDPRPAAAAAHPVVARARDTNAAVSPGRFRHLVRDAGAALAEARVEAVDGSNGLAHRGGGVMWITLTSRWGHGRVTRNADGSVDLQAFRTPDGATLLAEHHDHVEVDDLRHVIDAITRPERPRVLRHPSAGTA